MSIICFPDEALFRNLILWLEEQKIRHYKIEDRALLRETESTEWDKGYKKYMKDLACPINNKRNEEIEWLLTYAIRLEYTDDGNNKLQFFIKFAEHSPCLFCL